MDANFWNHFYEGDHHDIEKATTFARWCVGRIERGASLLELGCGNGRDALFFAGGGIRVIAVDQAETAIQHLNTHAETQKFPVPPLFLARDFTRLDDAFHNEIDVVYSRFTLHAITEREASQVLRWSHDNLRAGGSLFIEARSVKGSLYGQGTPAERDAFIHDGHYRRFLRREELESELGALGFHLEESLESAGLAIYKDDDPVVLRIVARKR